MKTLLIVAAVLFLLGMIKVGVHGFYEGKAFRLDLIISRYRMTLVGEEQEKRPKKPKKARRKKQPKKDPQQNKPKAASAQQNVDNASASKPKKSGGFQKFKPWLSALLDYWQDILGLIGRVLTSPTLDILRLEIKVGAGDAEACAMKYGKICAIVGAVLPVVENTFTIKKRKIDVLCLFDQDSMDISAEAAITIRIYEIFALVFALLGLGIKIFFQARK